MVLPVTRHSLLGKERGPVTLRPTTQVVDRTLPDEEEETEVFEVTPTLTKRLRQQTMYQCVCQQSRQERIDEDNTRTATSYCSTNQQNTTVHGHYHRSGTEILDNGLFRVYYNNVNGLSTGRDNNDIQMFVKSIMKKECAIVAITEPNRNFDMPQMRSDYINTMRNASTHHQTALASAQMGWPNNYQPGGTAITVRNKWATRFIDKGSDTMGRWSHTTLTGKGTTRVTFIVAYRVCDGGNEAPITSRTVRAQQEWMYATQGKKKVNLRKQCMIDLARVVNKFQQEGHDVVLCMDANEGNTDPNSGVAKLLKDTGLNDVHAQFLDEESLPPTHQRG